MRYDAAADESRDIAMDARYEDQADQQDWDGWESARAEDRYERQYLGWTS